MTDYKFIRPKFDDPYPAGPLEVKGFAYHNALVLVRFASAVKTRVKEDADYVVAADYAASWIAADGTVTRVVVPRGMLTDLTSVPPGLRWFIGRVGPWLEAAIVHDWLCIAWMTLDGDGSADRRKFADDVMLAAMKEARVNIVMRRAIYLAVRAWGWWRYPQQVDPDIKHKLYVDLGDATVQDQLSGGVTLAGLPPGDFDPEGAESSFA
ncbi:MAG: DUF1353 domain-containing protein [Rhodobacteraceae bacterium]|nr:DUF1353 domain-containing protein [Paracoccaceae bacterium]